MQIYPIILAAELIIAVPVFIFLFFIRAPYGKFTSNTGLAVKPTLGWFLMELPAAALPLYFFIKSGIYDDPIVKCFIVVWELHYIQRTFIYPFLLNKGSHKMPLLILFFSIAFNTLNGSLNGYGIFILKDYGTASTASVNLYAGLLVFGAGFILNLYSDHVLRNLRAPGETGYKIPDKGMYKLICSPNYLGEILEWAGWAILTLSLAGAAFLIFTVANLTPRAIANLKWYRETFPDYPENRKALVPYIL